MTDQPTMFDPMPGLHLLAAILDLDNDRIQELTADNHEEMIQALGSICMSYGIQLYGAEFRQVVAEQILDLEVDPLVPPEDDDE